MTDISDMAYGNTDEEYHEICDFLNELSMEDPLTLWESGRMNFWRCNIHARKSPQDPFFRDNVHVWRTSDQDGGKTRTNAGALTHFPTSRLVRAVLPRRGKSATSWRQPWGTPTSVAS